jgi:PBP1b-binding outer membrane lipoprotein LpoB
MKKIILVLSSALLLVGCTTEEQRQADQPPQTPRFGEPVSAIPWNQPTDWEKSGQLGSMPGVGQNH